MAKGGITIGIVAPACRIEPTVAESVTALAARLFPERPPALRFHPQCYLSAGHFAGTDEERASALIATANDPAIDAVWFARGGYGSCRIAERVLPALNAAARQKTYLGYSDTGTLLGGRYGAGFAKIAHGPMPSDIRRENGAAAVTRSLQFLVAGSDAGMERSVTPATPTAAFNITILSHLIGTPLEPDLAGHVLMLEEISEAMYRIDRSLGHITAAPGIRRLAGLRLGRCNSITPNTPEFAEDEETVARRWCKLAGIPYLGRADIGHDVENKIVPFGRWRPEAR